MIKKNSIVLPPLPNNEVINILRSSGRSRNVDDFPFLEKYLEDVEKYPRIIDYQSTSVCYNRFMEFIRNKFNIEEIYLKETYNSDSKVFEQDVVFFRLALGYYLEINVDFSSVDGYVSTKFDIKDYLVRDTNIQVGYGKIMCPPTNCSLYDVSIEDTIKNIFIESILDMNEESSHVGMICQEEGEFYMKDFYIKKDYSIKEADLHYGSGFLDFHNKLLERFKDDSKGLVLFHGVPGTGKTYYIRSLIKQLLKLGKYIIYLPPNMIEQMIDPSMMTFISSVVLEKAEAKKSCILLLEDAEPLLVSRKLEGRSNGITNLLNITDGLLNDMLSIQVIATFNTELSKIDEALLRPERLIARKEFKKLKPSDANALASYLGMDAKFTKDATTAEIYSFNKKTEILVHEYQSSEGKIGFVQQHSTQKDK